MSAVLHGQYDRLAAIDPRNDGNVLFYDQIIPRGTLLGFANADHWAVALPFDEDMPAASLLVTRNEYPRELLIEAAVRFVEEALAAGDPEPSPRVAVSASARGPAAPPSRGSGCR